MDNYIVSARKYRPMTFDSVVGQRALTTTLKNAIAQGKLAHAYLFCGPRGVGKTTCARIFAKTINCLTPTAEGEACGACESCVAFAEGRSYNIHELDAASNNSVEDIRGLIEQVQIPPQIGRYKVFIIDEVHMLSTAAFNAFLKTLEEPPAHAIFILATTEKHKILPTILSRCQIYDFSRITVSDTVAHLQYVAEKEGIAYEKEALHVIAEKADGGMRDALSIFDQVASFCEGTITYQKVIEDLNVLDYTQYFTMTDALLKTDIPAAMTLLNDILGHGFEGNYFIGGLASHFRNLLMSRDQQTLPLLDVSDDVRQRYHEQSTRCQPKFLYRALKLCNDCDMNYRTARNKRLLVEITLIEVAQAAAGDDDPGCGRRPARRLKPIFHHTAAAQKAAAAPVHTPAPTAPQPAAAAAPTPAAPQRTAATPLAPNIASLGTASTAPRVNARPAQTLSLHRLKAPAAPDPAATPGRVAEPAPAMAAAQKLRSPFTLDQLTHYWYRFAQQLPKEKSAIAGRMKNMQLSMDEHYCVSVTVDNDMVEEYMREEMVSLTGYLRQNLRNDYITLSFNVAAAETHRAFSRVEMLKDMLERSEALRTLQESLELELA